mgnify:CR=1 FL=1
MDTNQTSTQNSYTGNRLWSDSFTDQVVEILRANAMHMLTIRVATPEEDMHRSTDLVITVEGGDVAVRIRRASYLSRYRELTLRSYNVNGAKVELQKIIEGFGRWYLYAWADGDKITDWMLVDLNKVRESNLLDRPYIINKDGETGFIAITDYELRKADCMIAERTAP